MEARRYGYYTHAKRACQFPAFLDFARRRIYNIGSVFILVRIKNLEKIFIAPKVR